MGLENHSFSFYPFGTLFCMTLFCFVAVRLFAIRYRDRGSNLENHSMILILKKRVAIGELDEEDYQKLKELLKK